MQNLTPLEERFQLFDKLENNHFEFDFFETREDSKTIVIIPNKKSDESMKHAASEEFPKSALSPLTLNLDEISVSDEYIANKIERMVQYSQQLTHNEVAKALESVTDDPNRTVPTPYPVIGKSGGGRDYVIAAEYIYTANAGYHITVRKGFVTDLASVPRIFWVLINPDELSLAAPIVHDLLYRHGGDLGEDGTLPAGKVEAYRTFTRAESDMLFNEIMEREQIPSWRRRAAYFAVRHFAAFAWQDALKKGSADADH